MLTKVFLGSVLIAGLIAFVIFSPTIDQGLALIPYDSSSSSFYGETHLWCKAVYYIIPVITSLCIILPLWSIYHSWNKPNSRRSRKTAIIILLSLALGPGLVVNTIFKDNWGRPRPYQVIRDGKAFIPVYRHNFSEPKNNSFPCGHASIGFFLGVPFLALGRRRCGLLVSVVAGGFVGIVRMLQGGHYLSDVVFCGIFVWMVAELINYIVNKVMRNPVSG